MFKNLILLRFNQLVRLIRHTGVSIVLVLLLATVGFILNTLQFLSTITPSLFFIGALILLFLIHMKRNDLHFLQSIAKTHFTYRLCLFVEYLLVLIPFALFFLLFKKWELMIPVMVAPVIVALLPSIILIKKSDTKFVLPFLPAACFELKTHMEKNIVGYGLIGLIGLGSIFHISLFILFSLLLGANIFSAFQKLEPKELIVATNSFLAEKIKQNVRLVLLISFPIFSIALLFQAPLFYVVIYFYLTIFLAITFGILYKYAFANPIYPFYQSSMAQSLFFILPYLPGLIIANIGYQIYLWYKASKNLKQYYA